MNAAALLVAVTLALLVAGIHLLDRHLREGGSRQRRAQGARWASRRDLRALRVDGPEPGRVILGRQDGRLVAAEARASVVVVGPTTISLKTTGLVIPSVLEWQGPVLAASIKNDLLKATLARRRQMGEAMVYDPAGLSREGCVRATPLGSCGEWHGAMRVAHWLTSSARSAGATGLEDADFWYSAAEKLIAPLLFAAASSGGEMGHVIRWLNAGPKAAGDVKKRLLVAGSEDALGAWEANWNREERQRSSIYTTAETILGAFADPGVLAASREPEDPDKPGELKYTPARLLDGEANTLYLCAPAHEQRRLRSLFAAMVSEVVALVYERSAESGEPISPALLVVLDEAANIAPLPDLDGLASSGAGQGIQLLTVFQDLAQVQARYGARAQTIVNNHRAKVFATGIADPETLRYVSGVIGDGEFRQQSMTAGKEGQASATEGSHYRDLAPANVIREARKGSALLIYGHLPPARLTMRPWFEDRGLQELAEGVDRGG